MKCIIDNQVVLSRAPEGPLAAHIGRLQGHWRLMDGSRLRSTFGGTATPPGFSLLGTFNIPAAPVSRAPAERNQAKSARAPSQGRSDERGPVAPSETTEAFRCKRCATCDG